MPTKEELQAGFKIGDWEVLPAQGMLRCGDREETPEPLVFKLLMALATRDGNVASKEDLVTEVWDGYPVGDDSITRCVAQLRKHFGKQGKAYVKTLTKRGYRLDVKVLFEDPGNAQVAQDVPALPLRNQRNQWMVVAAIVVALFIGFVTDIGGMFGKGRIDSIAVLPFENLSGDEADQYRVSGFKVELVQTLHKLPGISVKSGLDTYPNLEVSEIAGIFDVDAVLFGELQRIGSALKITYRIAHGSDGEVIATGEFEGQVGEEFALQEQMAYQVRSALIGEPAQQLISETRHPNSEAYDRYMRGLFLLERRGRGRPDNLNMAIDLLGQAIEIDPAYGAPYLSLASAYVLLPDYANEPLAESIQRALEVIERGIEEDDSISDAAAEIIGFAHHKQRHWAEAEEAYVRATTAEVVDSNAFNWYSLMLAGVGRLDDALKQILIAQKIDPSSAVINGRVAIVYSWLGESERAAEHFQRASELGASGEVHQLGQALLQVREGNFEEAARLASDGISLSEGSTDWIEPLFAAMRDPSARDDALVSIEEAFNNSRVEPRLEIIARTMLRDIDGAMGVAMALAESGETFEMDILFIPELRPFREHPQFLELMQSLGVLSYWEEKQCTWKYDRVNCPS